MKLAILTAFLALPVLAQPKQPPTPTHYTFNASTEALTVQQVTGGNSRAVQFVTATVGCPSACTIYVGQNTAAATATAATITPYNANPPSRSAAFMDSNAGSVSGKPSVSCTAACTVVLDISMFRLGASAGTANNFTVASTVASSIMIAHAE